MVCCSGPITFGRSCFRCAGSFPSWLTFGQLASEAPLGWWSHILYCRHCGRGCRIGSFLPASFRRLIPPGIDFDRWALCHRGQPLRLGTPDPRKDCASGPWIATPHMRLAMTGQGQRRLVSQPLSEVAANLFGKPSSLLGALVAGGAGGFSAWRQAGSRRVAAASS